MSGKRQLIAQLGHAIEEFKKCINSLSESLFLKQMEDEWSPRDVLAHLIGWNRYTIDGCKQIIKGQTPFYFADAENDYANVNAESVQRYSSEDKDVLLDELGTSFWELRTHLLSVDLAHWETDFGIRDRGVVITVANTVEGLIRDYDEHRRQIEKWVRKLQDK